MMPVKGRAVVSTVQKFLVRSRRYIASYHLTRVSTESIAKKGGAHETLEAGSKVVMNYQA